MKKMFFAVLFLFPLLLGCTAGIREPAANPETDFEWSVNYRGEVSIKKYVGESFDVIIPEMIQGHPVFQIGANAFREKNLQSVKLPKTLTHIGERAFYKNELESIVIPEGVIIIERCAFENNNLVSVTFPNTLTYIKSHAFSENKLKKIVFPDSLKEIESYAFENNQLDSITFPEALSEVEEFAFSENNLREIILPQNMMRVGTAAFLGNNISNVIIYTEKLRIVGGGVFGNNPVVKLDLHTQKFSLVPAIHPTLPAFLPPGQYTLGDDETWTVQSPDGKFHLVQSYIEELAANDPGVLEQMLHTAIEYHDVALLRNAISLGADVNSKISGPRRSGRSQSNTPLAHAFYHEWWRVFKPEIIQILLEAGAVPQYWMLSVSYLYPRITKMLLEYGALTNPESTEYGDYPNDPDNYERPESLLLHYCLQLAGKKDRKEQLAIAESTMLLLEYGVDVNYRDPQTGQTPLTVALNSRRYSLDLVDSLLKSVSRPLPLEDYRRLIEFGARVDRWEWGSWRRNREEAGMDYIDYDEFVLEDVRRWILNPLTRLMPVIFLLLRYFPRP